MNEKPFNSGLQAADRYQVAELQFFPAGDDLFLVSVKNNPTARFLRSEIVDLLKQCQGFKTLDNHLQTYYRSKQAPATMMPAMRRELQRLVQIGYLVSQRSTLEAIQKGTEPCSPSRIATIGFPTCDRVEILQRGMTSYIEHCQRFDRDNDFVVVDDSSSPTTRDAYRQMLRTLKSHYSVSISYAGLEEKQAFADKISKECAIPLDVVYFACVGDKRYGVTTIGANRNALLLHTVGDLLFSADDDTICQVAASPTLKEGLALHSGKPSEIWFYPDRESALQSVNFIEQDVLALHEQWLGQDPHACMALYAQEDEISLAQIDPRMLRHLTMQPGRILLTSNGALGDCGWDNPDTYLFQRGDTFKRLTHSEQEYYAVRASREIMQVSSQITLTERTEAFLAMCIGLDNRALLPPFTPVGRAEELAFGIMAKKCFDATYAVHLPWLLLHAPIEKRAFSTELIFGVGWSAWIPSCLGTFDPGLAHTPTKRLYKLGQYLDELGHLQPGDFEEFVRLHMWRSMSSLVGQLEERLQNRSEPPPTFWQQDVRGLIVRLRQAALVPLDQLYMLQGGREELQNLLVRLGQVMKWWPEMIEAARRLRAQGYRLAQQI